MTLSDDVLMQRCFDLASIAGKNTLTNPNVGALVVADGRIIGEGFHTAFGQPHAEVNAINNAYIAHPDSIPGATLYVSLEPCHHHGKTPPCTDKIIQSGIQNVIISCLDPNPTVQGQGIEKLKSHGINVKTGVLEDQGKRLLNPFRAHLHKKPYVILKWAQSSDFKIGLPGQRIHISNSYTNALVHKWRSEVDGILVGSNTINVDNPKLTTRWVEGSNPMRIILDPKGDIQNTHLHIFNDGVPTLWVIQTDKIKVNYSTYPWIQILDFRSPYALDDLLKTLFLQGIYYLMVEGGRHTLQTLLDAQLWDEIRLISSRKTIGDKGIPAPYFYGTYTHRFSINTDTISIIHRVP